MRICAYKGGVGVEQLALQCVRTKSKPPRSLEKSINWFAVNA